MKIRFVIAMLPVIITAHTMSPKIHHIDHITDIARYVHYDGPLTLVCFDIDETLLYPNQPEARDAWFGERVKKLVAMGIPQAEAIRQTITQQIIAHKKGAVCQADWDEDELVTALKKRGVRVICVTARSLDFVDITYRQLKQVRINLTQHGAWNRCYILKNLPKPAYYTPGVIFCAGNDKGNTLEQFINQLKYKPTHIIMVDDTPKHVEALERMTKQRGIRYDGFVITHTWRKQLPCNIFTDGEHPHNPSVRRASN